MANSKNWRHDWLSVTAVICLSLVCLAIGTIHFMNSGMKADGSLVALIVLCFAPWLGKVFRSIGKDGLIYPDYEEGRADEAPALEPEPTSEQNVEAQRVVEERLPESEQEFVNRLSRERPQVLAALVRDSMREDPPFLVLAEDAKKVLATLWKYQQRYVGPNGEGRWTFVVHTGAPDHIAYVRGLVGLASYRFVAIADNGQVCLTDKGIEYCQRHIEQLANERTYDKFDN